MSIEKEYTSHAVLYLSCLITSGAICLYDPVSAVLSSPCAVLASPKSPILYVSWFAESNMFSDFKSRCKILLLWMYVIPETIWQSPCMIVSILGFVPRRFMRACRSFKLPPMSNSHIIVHFSLHLKTKNIDIIFWWDIVDQIIISFSSSLTSFSVFLLMFITLAARVSPLYSQMYTAPKLPCPILLPSIISFFCLLLQKRLI